MKDSNRSITLRKFLHIFPILTCTAVLLSSTSAAAQGTPAPAPAVAAEPAGSNININPKRITFDRIGKSATVSVFNQGGASGNFDVEFIDRIMLPDGQIVPVGDAALKPELKPILDKLKSAKALMVVTPRRVKLTPNGGQAIRVRAIATADVPPGEYRTHLTVTAIPPADIGLTAEQAAAQADGQLSFRVNSVLGISIPVILRVGPIDVRAAIEHPAITYATVSPDGRSPPVKTAILSFELVRTGANSLFGDVEVRGSKKGDATPIGVVRGIGVYPEIDRRLVKMSLRRLPAAGEKIDVQFRDDDTAPGAILSKASLMAP